MKYNLCLSIFFIFLLTSCFREAALKGLAIEQVQNELALAESVHIDVDKLDFGKAGNGNDYWIFQVKIGYLNRPRLYGKIILPQTSPVINSGQAYCVGYEIIEYGNFIWGSYRYIKNPLIHCNRKITKRDIQALKLVFGWVVN